MIPFARPILLVLAALLLPLGGCASPIPQNTEPPVPTEAEPLPQVEATEGMTPLTVEQDRMLSE